MKKSVMMLKMFSAMFAVLAVAGIVAFLTRTPKTQTVSDTALAERGAQQSVKTTADAGQTEKPSETAMEDEISHADIQKLEMKLEKLEQQETGLLESLAAWRALPDGLTKEQLDTIARSRVIQCYEENVVLAVEAKTLLIGGLGVSIPSGYAQDDAMAAYGDYLKEQLGVGGLNSVDDLGGYLAGELMEGVVGQVGSEAVQNAVRYGMEGALDAYKADGTLGSVLTGAVDSVVEGVVSDIQEYPYELAKNVLNEVTGGLFSIVQYLDSSDSPEEFLQNMADEVSGGLFSSVASALTYESSPTALFQSMSQSASDSAARLSTFLEKDTINSTDIANMMYQYSQYGEVLHDLNNYDWSESYSAMQEVYTQFVQNEVMIAFLSKVVEGDLGEELEQTPQGVETIPEADKESESPDSESRKTSEGSPKEQYEALEKRISQLEENIPAYQEELSALMNSKFTVMDKYEEQLNAVKDQYAALRAFNVKNFEAQYDVDGSRIIEDNKKINHAIGELSQYTPWRITLGLFSSMAMEDGNQDYAAMVSANDAFGTGMQTITVDTKAEIEKFNAQITFYEGLIETRETGEYLSGWGMHSGLQQACENQYLLEHVLNGEEINLDSYAKEVQKKLYIMGQEVGLIRDFYATLLTDGNHKSVSMNKLSSQYQEIMAAADPDGTGEIAGAVTAEELAGYVIPLIDAGRQAENTMSNVGAASPLVDRKYYYSMQGKEHWFEKSGRVMKFEGVGGVYYANGKPVYVGGLYFCNGILLNGDENVDAEKVYEAAKYLTGSQSGMQQNMEIIENELRKRWENKQ